MSKIDSFAFIAEGAKVLKDVTIGKNSSVWFNTTIRGDQPITIGDNTNIQDNSCLHIDLPYPMRIGNGVTIGHGCIIHGCIIDDDSLIGMGSIIMNGAHIGKECLIGAGTLITQNTVIPDRSLVFGRPGKVIRPVTDDEIAFMRHNAQHYAEEGKQYKAEGYEKK